VSELSLDENLRFALMEALREDWEQLLSGGEDAYRESLRQRRRLRKMLADPRGYYRRYFRGGRETKEGGATFACPQEVRIRKKHILRLVIAAVVAALLAGSALAYSLTGGEFFTRMFNLFERELGLDAGVADMSQLAVMDDAELGTILETDELRFELMDAVSGGYMSMVAIRVTCKQADKVIEKDKDGNCLWQASFKDIGGTLTDNTSIANAGYGISCRYDGDEMELKPNQFYMVFNTNSTETVKAGTYTLELHDLMKSGEKGDTVLCAGDWTLEIPLEDGEKYAHTVSCGETYPIGNTDYLLERVQYSPLSMNLYFSSDCQTNQFGEDFIDYSVTLKDGKVLDRPWFCCGISSGSDASGTTANVTLEFNAPLNVNEIESVQFSGNSVDLAGRK